MTAIQINLLTGKTPGANIISRNEAKIAALKPGKKAIRIKDETIKIFNELKNNQS